LINLFLVLIILYLGQYEIKKYANKNVIYVHSEIFIPSKIFLYFFMCLVLL